MGRDSCKKRESERNQGSYSIMWLSSGTESQLPIAILVLHMSGFQDAVSKFQFSNQDPGQGFELQFPSFKFQTKIQVGVSRSSFSCLVCAFMDGHVYKLSSHE